MQTKFKVGSFAALAFMMAGVWATPLAAQKSSTDLFQEGEERARLLVVRITAPTTEGAGILFHADGKYAYGITARHVLFRQGKVVEGLQAHFQAWPNHQFPVEYHKVHHQEDLAVFKADLSALNKSAGEILRFIPLDQLGSSEGLDPGDVLHSMGHSTVGGWISPEKELKFGREEKGKNSFLFELDCPQGHSGGAVFDKDWGLVGMMIEEERPYCRALRIEPIMKIVQAWKLNVSLRLPPARQTDKPSSKQITVAVMDFDNRSGRKDLPNLGFVAQDITTASLYDLPGVDLVTRDRLDSVRKEIGLTETVQSGKGISRVGRLLNADALVTGSIVRYDEERRTFTGYGTSALQDVVRMSISLQILHVDTGRVQFSKTFDVERTQQYPVASSAPPKPVDRTSELLGALLEQAKGEMRNALSQVAAGGGEATKFIRVRVTTKPAGADVVLNGTYLGPTPYDLQVSPDSTHDLKLELSGHESWHRRIKIQPGMAIDVDLAPK